MFFWYTAGAVFAVWNVFQSAGLDFRAVALGALLPLVIDLPVGHQAFAHSLLAPVALLTLVMLATSGRGHRLLRRRIIGLPIGWFCGIALSGAFASQHLFWWPAFGADFGHDALLPAVPVIAIEELLGLLALRWIWVRFGLRSPARRRDLVRRGRLVVAGS
ncbi:MAG TPA: hypothetical protein VH914_08580 [Acidimicrobiia bacterium]|nr:hypothetical protein [Acidimicrobiia bacterium]